MVQEIQREHIFPETVLSGICDESDTVPDLAEPESVDESTVQDHGWLGHLGDRERRTETDNRVH